MEKTPHLVTFHAVDISTIPQAFMQILSAHLLLACK